MKVLLISIISVFLMSSCAHHHKELAHHDHKCGMNCKLHHKKGEMFDKHCAYSVSEGDVHVQGSDDFKLEHGGETYYFSSEMKLNKFKKDLEVNINSARRNWREGSARR